MAIREPGPQHFQLLSDVFRVLVEIEIFERKSFSKNLLP